MAHPWRIEYEGALYRVFSRGNNRQDIFVTIARPEGSPIKGLVKRKNTPPPDQKNPLFD